MAKSYASTVSDASPDEVWAHIRDFNGLATWHSGLVSTSEIEDGRAGDQVGGIRSFTLTDGTHIREQLVTHSDSTARTPTTSRRRPSTSTTTARRSGSPRSRTAATPYRDRDQQEHWTDFFATQIFQGGFDALKSHFA